MMATLGGWGGAPWRSWAVFEADAFGEVALATAPALTGSYRGVSAMGLFWSMERQDEAAPAIPLDGDFPLTLVAGGSGGARGRTRARGSPRMGRRHEPRRGDRRAGRHALHAGVAGPASGGHRPVGRERRRLALAGRAARLARLRGAGAGLFRHAGTAAAPRQH